MKVHLTVKIKSLKEKVNETKSMLEDLVLNSRKEPACIQYDLHQSIESPDIFILHETWENKEGLDLHNQKPYLKSFGEVAKSLLEEPVLVHKTIKIK